MESRRAMRQRPLPFAPSSTRAGSLRSPASSLTRRAADSGASMHAWCADCPFRRGSRLPGRSSLAAAMRASPPMTSSPISFASMPPTVARWPRILSEQLVPIGEPLAVALEPAGEAAPRQVAATAARALLDVASVARLAAPWPAWLAPHQIPAAERLTAIIAHYGGALLADEVGLGKSYVALAVALTLKEPFTLVVPAVLVSQWRALVDRF